MGEGSDKERPRQRERQRRAKETAEQRDIKAERTRQSS